MSVVKLPDEASWPLGVSMRDVARHWKVSANTVRKLAREGRLRGLQVSNRVYFAYDQLVEVLGPPVVAITDRYRHQPAA